MKMIDNLWEEYINPINKFNPKFYNRCENNKTLTIIIGATISLLLTAYIILFAYLFWNESVKVYGQDAVKSFVIISVIVIIFHALAKHIALFLVVFVIVISTYLSVSEAINCENHLFCSLIIGVVAGIVTVPLKPYLKNKKN